MKIGLGLLIAGFIWIVFDATSSFVSYQHIRWIAQSKGLPAGEVVPRDEAVSAMRELSLCLKNRHRYVVVPSVLMLAGGLMIYFFPSSRHKKQQAEQVEAPDR